MTPEQLHLALARTPARSAQVLTHRLLDSRSREACAALYGLKPETWDVLFLRSARDFQLALGMSPKASDETEQAAQLQATLTPELAALAEHKEQLKRLIEQAHADYEASPASTVEIWARRIAIVVIIALTAYFYWREEERKKAIPYAPYLTEPKKK